MARGKPFVKGQSGNPSGRPAGARSKSTLAAQALLDGEAEALTRKAIELAISGDAVALRLCLDRILPARKDRPVAFDLPVIQSAADASHAHCALLEAVARGAVTPTEAFDVAKLIESYVKSLETRELEERIAVLEQRAGHEAD